MTRCTCKCESTRSHVVSEWYASKWRVSSGGVLQMKRRTLRPCPSTGWASGWTTVTSTDLAISCVTTVSACCSTTQRVSSSPAMESTCCRVRVGVRAAVCACWRLISWTQPRVTCHRLCLAVLPCYGASKLCVLDWSVPWLNGLFLYVVQQYHWHRWTS